MEVYADNAATTRLSKSALNAMAPYFCDIYGNPSSLHHMGQKAHSALEEARLATANAIGCERSELYFTSGGSEADNWAIKGTAELMAKKGKKHIISTTVEHHAVLHTLKKLEKQGFEITLLPVSVSRRRCLVNKRRHGFGNRNVCKQRNRNNSAHNRNR